MPGLIPNTRVSITDIAAIERQLNPLFFDFRLPPFIIIGQQKNHLLAVRSLTSLALSPVGLFAGFDDINAVIIRARNGNSDHRDLFRVVEIQPFNSIVKYELETLPTRLS